MYVTSKLLTTTVYSLTGSLHPSTSTELSAAVTKLLETHFRTGTNNYTALASHRVRRIEVGAQRDALALVFSHDTARQWLEKGIKARDKSYMVVGCMTVLDAKVTQAQNQDRSVGGNVTIPVGTVLGGGADFTGITDPSVGATWKANQGEKTLYTAPGEMIWAIAYRRIKFDLLMKKSVETAYLDKEFIGCHCPRSEQKALRRRASCCTLTWRIFNVRRKRYFKALKLSSGAHWSSCCHRVR